MNPRIWIPISLCVLTVLVPGMINAQGDKGKDDKVAVKALKFMPKDPTAIFMIGGQSKLTVLENAEAVEKLIGKDNAKTLVGQVDFTKEKIAFVSWTTSGPPEGKLTHEIKGEGKDRKVTFYVQGPKNAAIRGQRARLGADFFSVPRDLAVNFDSKER